MKRRSSVSTTQDLNAERPSRNSSHAVGPAVVDDARRLLKKIEELYGPGSRDAARARRRVVRLEEQAKPTPEGIRCNKCNAYRLNIEHPCPECLCPEYRIVEPERE